MKMKTRHIAGMATAVLMATAHGAGAQEDIKFEVTRIGIEDNVYTPYYEARTERDHELAAAAKWIRLDLEYTTDGGWIDELQVEHIGLIRDWKGDQPIVLTREVTYMSVGPGDHVSHVYMHPSLVERYEVDSSGMDVAVRVRMNGKLLAKRETTNNAPQGWSDKIGQAPIHKGHLLNHAETPFWFINYDFREMIKREPHAHIDAAQ